MNNFIKLSQEEQKLIINNTAEKMKIANAIVEKDFWVCFVLDYLFSDFKYKDYICFKGGTSLSKVYHLVERFSEDIDIALDWELLKYKPEEPYIKRSNRQQDFFNKEVNVKTEILLYESWLPIIRGDFNNYFEESFELYIDKDDPQTICFRYPQFFYDSSILQIVRLEVGALAEPVPSNILNLSSYIAQSYPDIFSRTNITVKSVDPVRTFYEKLLILHREAHRTNGNYPMRYSRHYYDVYKMINSDVNERSIDELEILRNVIEFKKKFYPSMWANYDSIYEGNLVLVPNKIAIKLFEKDYQSMKNMIYGDVPSFDMIISSITIFESEINQKIKQVKFNK